MKQDNEWPQKGDLYWGVQAGEIFSKVWNEDERDLGHTQYLPVYKSKEEAEEALKEYNKKGTK